MKYLKIFTDFKANLELLTAEEVGNLFLAMIDYAEDGTEPDLQGNERFVWGAARLAIDHARAFSEKQAKNGALGGRPTKANEANETQTKPEKPKKAENKRKENKRNENKRNINNLAEPVITMPLNNGSDHVVTEEDVNTWADAYPDINVSAELKKMTVWLNANPTRWKTAAGINRFITSWLSRAEEAAPKKPKKTSKYAEIYDKY